MMFLKPTPFVLHTMKSLWTGDVPIKLNVPQFIEDMNNQLAVQTDVVKKSLASKVSKEADIIGNFKVGDTEHQDTAAA